MRELTFVTGNDEKFRIAQKVFAVRGINLTQQPIDIDEIQSEDAEKIVLDKVAKAYQALQRPVVVNDDSWAFPGLGGFPGPYMKSIVQWFTADDFLRLTSQLSDRRVILTQWIAYQDAYEQKTFEQVYTGTILKEIRGNYGLSFHKLISMPGDDGLSVAEAYDKGVEELDREVAKGWADFVGWYGAQAS
jgi:XTP/dITP diphosphohydrolase